MLAFKMGHRSYGVAERLRDGLRLDEQTSRILHKEFTRDLLADSYSNGYDSSDEDGDDDDDDDEDSDDQDFYSHYYKSKQNLRRNKTGAMLMSCVVF